MKYFIDQCRKWFPMGEVPEVSPQKLLQLLKSKEDVQLLDVRTRGEWRRERINGAVNVPITRLNTQVIDLPFDKAKPIVAICLSAHRSIPAVRILKLAGYRDVKQLGGGMRAWSRAFPNEVVK